MATQEQVVQDLANQPESLVSAPEDFISRIPRALVSGFATPAQELAKLSLNPEGAAQMQAIRESMATNAPTDLLPTNPELDNTFSAGLARGIGAAVPDALIAGFGGPAGMAAVLGKGGLSTQISTEEAQRAYDEAVAAGETPEGPRPSIAGEQVKGAASLGAMMLGGRLLQPFTNPLIAAAPAAARVPLSIASQTAGNLGSDILTRTAFNAYNGKPLAPFANPGEAGEALAGATAFGIHPGFEQAGKIPSYVAARDLAKARQMIKDATEKAAQAKVVEPNTPPPEPTIVKPATETETGVSVEPAKIAPPLTPTSALDPNQTLVPNSAATAQASATKDPQVVITPKVEPAKAETKQTPPTVLEPADRLKAIEDEMERIEKHAGVDDETGGLLIADPETQKVYDALAAEKTKLALGVEPSDLNKPAPVSGQERPKVENAPPPFTGNEEPPAAPVETVKQPAVKPEEVTTKVTEGRTEPELANDLSKLSDDELARAENAAKDNPDALKLIDSENERRANAAGVGEVPAGEAGAAGTEPIVAENAQRGTGVPGNEGVTGERGQESVPGLTPEETKELDELWKKPKATRADLDRIDELQAKIPAPENLRPDSPKSNAALLIRKGGANGLQIANRIRENMRSTFADLGNHLAERFKDSLGSLKVVYDPNYEGAHYDGIKHTITIGEKLLDDQTISHELIHAITNIEVTNSLHAAGANIRATGLDYLAELRKAQNNPDLPRPMKDLLGQYFHALNAFDVDKKILGQGSIANMAAENTGAGRGVHYGLVSVDEFLSEAFTSREFQDLLNRIPDPRGGTVWTRVVDAVSRILGVKPDQKSLLTAVLKSGLEVGDLQSVGNSEAAAEARKVPANTNEPNPIYQHPEDRGDGQNIPPEQGTVLPPGFRTEPGGLTAYKELPKGVSQSPIDQSPTSRRVLFSAKPQAEEAATGAPKEGQGEEKTFVGKAFDAIKNLPIVSKVANSAIAQRIAERLKPSVQDLRESIESKFRGMEFIKNNAATQAREAIARAFNRNKEDMAAAYPILEAGGGRIGPGATEAEAAQHQQALEFLKGSEDRLNDPKLTPEERTALQDQIDNANQVVSDFNNLPPTAEEVKRSIQYELNNGRKALESDQIPQSAKDIIAKFIPAYEHALENFDRLLPGAKRVKEVFDDAYQLRRSVDPDAHYLEDYVSRVYELNKTRGDSPLPPESLIGGGKSGITSFDKARKYDTIMDAMIGRRTEGGGYESESPKSLDVSDLAGNHTAISNDIVSNKLLQDQFETTSYPETNEPLFVPKPKVGESLPPNYVRIDGPFKQPVFVYKPIADLFKSIYGESQLRATDTGQVLLKTSGAIKHGTLALDTFHLSRVYQKAFMEAVASGDWKKVADFKKDMPSYTEQGDMGKYLGTLNVAPKDVDAFVKAGELTPEAGEFVKGLGQVLKRRGEDGGLLAGRFTDNLWKDAESFLKTAFDTIHFPKGFDKLQEFNKFTFERTTKAAMLSAFESRLSRIDKDFPELTEHQRNIKAAKEVNEQFGNIGRSGLLKSKTAQDYAQLFMLAPNWVQSQIMAEARQYGQGARSIFDATVGKKLPNGERERVFRVGNSARFLATTALSVFAANQAINLAFRHHPTWDNPEKDHKFDAWIPSVTGGPGFFYSPIALASEYAHHLHNYGQYESTPSAVAHIASNKLSPLASAAKVALTQKDYMGNKLTPGQTAVAAVKQALPIPIIAGSAAKGLSSTQKQGTTQYNLSRSAGFSLDKAPDAVAQAYQAFQPYRGRERPDTGPSPYRDLKTLVQNGASPEDIRAEVDRLQKDGKKIDSIRKSFEPKPFSGSIAGDLKGLKELGPDGKRIYDAAKAQKQAERQAFYKALQSK